MTAATGEIPRLCAYCASKFHGKEVEGVTDKCDCRCHARSAADVREMCPSCDSTNVENVADPYDDETDDVAMVCQDCGEPYGR